MSRGIEQTGKEKRKLIVTRSSFVAFFAMISVSLFVLFSTPSDMKLLPVLSIIASLILSLVLLPEYKRNHSTTVLVFAISAGLKYILQPLLFCISPIYTISRYTPSDEASIEMGIVLMIYELIAVSIVVVYSSKRYAYKYSSLDGIYNKNSLSKENTIIIGFFTIAVFALMVLYPDSTNEISFMALKANSGARIAARESDTIAILLRQIVLIGIYSSFVLVASWCKKRFDVFKKRLYVYIALFSALIITMVIYGEARSSQIYSGFAAYILLSRMFPDQKGNIRRILLTAVVLVISVLTVYKTFYAFNYSSYADAIASSNYGFETITFYADADFGGPISYAAVIDLKQTANRFGIVRFIYGLLRSTMGTNLLVKGLNISTSSMVYNLFLTGGTANTGYLLPITGLGYLFFGILLAPIITCLMYRIAFYLEYRFRISKSPFSVFFLAYCYIRLASCIVFTNVNTILSLTSMMLLTAGLLYLANYLVDNTLKKHL